MSILAWIVIVAVVWMAVAVVVGVVIGRAIWLRDRQVPGRFFPIPSSLLDEPADECHRADASGGAAVGPEHRRSRQHNT